MTIVNRYAWQCPSCREQRADACAIAGHVSERVMLDSPRGTWQRCSPRVFVLREKDGRLTNVRSWLIAV